VFLDGIRLAINNGEIKGTDPKGLYDKDWVVIVANTTFILQQKCLVAQATFCCPTKNS